MMRLPKAIKRAFKAFMCDKELVTIDVLVEAINTLKVQMDELKTNIAELKAELKKKK